MWRKQIVSKKGIIDAAVEEEFFQNEGKYKTVTKSLTDRADKRTHSLWQRLYDVVYKGYMPCGFTLSDKETWRILGLAGLIMFKVYAVDRIVVKRVLATVLGNSRSNFAYLWSLGTFFRTFLAVSMQL